MLYSLLQFFKLGRHENGSYLSENESMENATERNLSVLSEQELLSLRSGAEKLIEKINAELSCRMED